tara:strand:- start:24 stop:251 length:228 start_codon:yes stop_codon:yes gene_type:complete
MINVVFAILMITNGSVIEYVPTDGMSDCLEQKRIVTRSVGEDQDGLVIQCKEVKAELYEDCVADTCRLKIKRIVE